MKSLGRFARSVAMATHRPVMGSLRNSDNACDSSGVASGWIGQLTIIPWRPFPVRSGGAGWAADEHRSTQPLLIRVHLLLSAARFFWPRKRYTSGRFRRFFRSELEEARRRRGGAKGPGPPPKGRR